MYVCICHAVTDFDVERAVDDGARSVEDVTARTSAGGTCAMCHEHLAEIVLERCGSCPFAAMQVA